MTDWTLQNDPNSTWTELAGSSTLTPAVPEEDGAPDTWLTITPEGSTMTPEERRATETAVDAANRAQGYRDTVQAGIATNATTLSGLQILIVQQNAIAAGLTAQYELLDEVKAAADADAAATAADRVATGLDRIATGADRVQTGLDRVATGQDKAATAADRTQVGIDRTAAQTARTGAETAQTGAQTARTGAETAQTGAQTARTGAETARDAALGYRDTANTAAGTATTKAGEAATSAASALTLLNDFKGRYYGAAAADPATDPNGNPSDTGDIYYNTTSHIPRVFDSVGGWKDLTATVTMGRWIKNTTAPTSVFSGVGDSGGALAYTPGLELVFIESGFVPRINYTATNGTSIDFGAAQVPAGKEVVVLELVPFNVANAMTIAQADTKYRPIIGAQSKTAGWAVVAADYDRRFSFNGTANATLTLPASSAVFSGFGFYVKNNSNFILTVTPAGADTIDGAASLQLLPKQECSIGLTTGTTWETFGLAKTVRLSKNTYIGAANLPAVFPLGFSLYKMSIFNIIPSVNSDLGLRVSFDSGANYKFDARYFRGAVTEINNAAVLAAYGPEANGYVGAAQNSAGLYPAKTEITLEPGGAGGARAPSWRADWQGWSSSAFLVGGAYLGFYDTNTTGLGPVSGLAVFMTTTGTISGTVIIDGIV